MCTKILRIAERILDFESVPNGQYIVGKRYESNRGKRIFKNDYEKYSIIPKNNYEELNKYFNNLNNLGEYEKVLLDLILFPINQVHAIWGAVGSGKTATMQFVCDFFLKNFKKSNLDNSHYDILYIDINSVSSKGNYYNNILDSFSSNIQPIITRNSQYTFKDFIEKAEEFLPNNNEGYSVVTNTIDELYNLSANPDEYRSQILQYVRTFEPNKKLKFWLALLDIKRQITNSNVVIFVDNTDKLIPRLQLELLLDLINYPNPFQDIIIFLSIRLHNLYNLNNSALTVKSVIHSAVIPLEILKLRLLNFVLNKHESIDNNLDNKDTFNFYIRSVEILYFLTSSKIGWLKTFFNAIGGFSIRRLLQISQYLFNDIKDNNYLLHYTEYLNLSIKNEKNETLIINEINNRIKCLRNKKYDINNIDDDVINEIIQPIFNSFTKDVKYDVKKREKSLCELLVNNYHSVESEIKYLIEDLFHLKFRKLTLIKIRILQIIDYLDYTTTNEEFVRLLLYFNYIDEDICDAINTMLQSGKRLIWMDSDNKINSISSLKENGDYKIGFTRSGEYYYKELMKNSLYCECMLISKNISVSLPERTKYIFNECFELFKKDIEDFEYINKLYASNKNDTLIECVLSAVFPKNKGFISLSIIGDIIVDRILILGVQIENRINKSKINEEINLLIELEKNIIDSIEICNKNNITYPIILNKCLDEIKILRNKFKF